MDLRKDEEHHLVILDMERFTKTSLLAYKIVIIIYPLYSFITNFVIDYKTDFKNLYSSLKVHIVIFKKKYYLFWLAILLNKSV